MVIISYIKANTDNTTTRPPICKLLLSCAVILHSINSTYSMRACTHLALIPPGLVQIEFILHCYLERINGLRK